MASQTSTSITVPPRAASAPAALPERYVVQSTSMHARLQTFNYVLAAVHFAMFVAIVTVANQPVSFVVYRPMLQPNLAVIQGDDTGWLLMPDTPAELGSLDFRALIAGFFFVTAFFHLGYAHPALFHEQYKRNILTCRNPLRWVEYGMSASIMAVCIAFFCGIQDGMFLLCLAALTATTMTHGHAAEGTLIPRSESEYHAHPLGRNGHVTLHMLGYLPQACVWVAIISIFSMLTGGGEGRGPPDWVRYVPWTQGLLFWSFGFVQLWTLTQPPSRFVYGEYAYSTLSAVCKLLLGLLIFFNVLFADGAFDR